MKLRPLHPQEAKALGMNDVYGLVVLGVQPGSRAAEQGLRKGDVILEIDKARVSSQDDFQAAVKQAGDKEPPVALLLIKRKDHNIFVTPAPGRRVARPEPNQSEPRLPCAGGASLLGGPD